MTMMCEFYEIYSESSAIFSGQVIASCLPLILLEFPLLYWQHTNISLL